MGVQDTSRCVVGLAVDREGHGSGGKGVTELVPDDQEGTDQVSDLASTHGQFFDRPPLRKLYTYRVTFISLLLLLPTSATDRIKKMQRWH